MSKWWVELKGLKGWMLIMPLLYYLLLLASILLADSDRPRNLFYYNEMAFLPLLVMLVVLFFQREFGGSSMEIYATLPISFGGMLVRKAVLLVCATILLHLGWTLFYWLKFHQLRAGVYHYFTDQAMREETRWLPLFLQALPEYLIIMATTMLTIILFKRLYGGMLAGFLIWMIEVLSGGSLFAHLSLLTINLPREGSFTVNRFLLILFSILFFLISLWLINRRQRWILHEEIE